MKIVSKNRKAYFEYEILEKFVAGIVLTGWQVKAIKDGNVSLKQAFCYIRDGEVYVKGLLLAAPNGLTNLDKSDINRDLKILLHKSEIVKLTQKTKTKGFTIVPLAIGLVRGYVKIEIGLARGKQNFDKRQKIKERQQKRDITRQLKNSKYF